MISYTCSATRTKWSRSCLSVSSIEQDQGLEELSKVLRRQKDMGLAIGREVEGHIGETDFVCESIGNEGELCS